MSNEMKYKIVFIRHGESEYNEKNLFCGWHDADLSTVGLNEAKNAGKMLSEKKLTFDVAYTSLLKRAIKTLQFVLDELDLNWIPVNKEWRLNERMYGALQGLDKAETAAKYGEDQVKIWRRSFDIPPPALDESDPRWPGHEAKYSSFDKSKLPKSECLKDTVERVLPLWNERIVPDIKNNKKVLITAHGNSIRAIIKYLDNIEDDKIVGLNIPTGIPLVYELDENLKPIRHYYTADDEVVNAAINKVANQAKSK